MKIIEFDASNESMKLLPSAATIGNFDGVHVGHKEVIKIAKNKANKLDLPLSLITFNPHPRDFFSKSCDQFLLLNQNNKLKYLQELRIDQLINIKFDKLFSNYTAENFIKKILNESLNIKHIFVGRDFHFGKNRSGNIDTLLNIGKNYSIGVTPIELKSFEGEIISSTAIRKCLSDGDIQKVNKSLGRPYIITGIVVEGDKRGRQINFPTANLELSNLLRPAFGVYAVTVNSDILDNAPGIANIGRRPTVNDRGELIEVHLFDRELDLYGKELDISLRFFLREEKKFESFNLLKNQIKKDAKKARFKLNL